MANVHIFYNSDGNFDVLLNNLIELCKEKEYDMYYYDESKDDILKIVGERNVKFENDGYMFNVDDKPVINIIRDYSTEKFNSDNVLRHIIRYERRANVFSIACCTNIDNFRRKEEYSFESISYNYPNKTQIYSVDTRTKAYMFLSQLIR
jgi:hypothetical protein